MGLFFAAPIKVVLFHQREWPISASKNIGSTEMNLPLENSDLPWLDKSFVQLP
jgi:hypothetical protein